MYSKSLTLDKSLVISDKMKELGVMNKKMVRCSFETKCEIWAKSMEQWETEKGGEE